MTQVEPESPLDLITTRRLRQLAQKEPDTGALEDRLRSSIPRAKPSSSPRWGVAGLLAASLLAAAGIWWVVGLSGTAVGPAVAEAAGLADIHYDVVHDLSPHHVVSNVAEVNAELAEDGRPFEPVPPLPGRVVSCCLHTYAGTTLSCVVLELDGEKIIVALARPGELILPDGPRFEHRGRQLKRLVSNGITLVMAEHAGRWVGVMGDGADERLLEVIQAVIDAIPQNGSAQRT